jgi:hypothetical protein
MVMFLHKEYSDFSTQYATEEKIRVKAPELTPLGLTLSVLSESA